MRSIGFSTGALALARVDDALRMLDGKGTTVIELSALRPAELPVLAATVERHDLRRFKYISVHAPSRWDALTEREGVELLRTFADRGWPIVLHPDCIENANLWRAFGALLLIENMDKRKPIGRSKVELERAFDSLPDASLCFDIGHARQFDTTMVEAYRILTRFKDRLRQVHLSHVDSRNAHVTLRWASIQAFQRVANLIPEEVPIILETPVTEDGIEAEIELR